jgi:hypothetical protein
MRICALNGRSASASVHVRIISKLTGPDPTICLCCRTRVTAA